MIERTYNPELARRSVAELAAVTDDELAADIRTTAAAMLGAATAWRTSADWRGDDVERRAYATITGVRDACA